jgi:hypothetical protein
MFPNHNLESNNIYKSKYYKYKKKYLDLKNGGALRSSSSNSDDKDKPKFELRSKSVGYETNVDPTTLNCKNITDRDPITLEPITSIPSNRLIILPSGRCVNVLNFLNYRIMENKYRDPMTRNVFSNELINQVREKLLELGQTIPDWMNDYDQEADQENDDSDEEEEYVYETDDDDSSSDENSPSDAQIFSYIITKAKYEISTSPYEVDNDMIKQAIQQSSGDNTFPASVFLNQVDYVYEIQDRFYHAEVINILYKLVKFKKEGIDDNIAKKLAFLLYRAIRPTIYGVEPPDPALQFISSNFAEGGLDFSGVFNKLNDMSVGKISELINGIFPMDDIPLGLFLDPKKYWIFMKYDNTTNSYQYLNMEQVVDFSRQERE